jgi:hypothetical protein
MRWTILFLTATMICGFGYKLNVPCDLPSSKVFILKIDFDQWKAQIDSIPNGFDDHAQHFVYGNYVVSIAELEAYMKKEKISVKIVENRKDVPGEPGCYLLNYKITCEGGKGTNDWWLVRDGFFFENLKTGSRSDFLGTTKVVKMLKKQLRKNCKR